MPEITIIPMVLTAALVLVSLFLTASPYFTWDVYATKQSNPINENHSKEELLTTLNELEFDHKMGKLSDTDYFHLKKQYEIQVAKMIRANEQKTSHEPDNSLKAEVEREIEETIKTYKLNKRDGMK
ncbi:hypothetical protein [Bacillus sp. FJAT-27251]|uniref:hypothetical protein n=1 Tax=Bacillus sp. FJAT-27251 TaxID=1684142 RepID=UPI0006A79D16|nr:hypothetical protein [Bacillus sp. FJAT-27251]